MITHTGTIVGATFVDAPRQRISRDKNKQVKNGETPAEWKTSTHKLAQKDTDARWTKKNNETHFGYKSHLKVDADRAYVGKEIPNHMENNIGLRISCTT